MQRVNVFLSDKQVTALKSLSKKTGLTYSEWIRRAVDRLLAGSQKERVAA